MTVRTLMLLLAVNHRCARCDYWGVMNQEVSESECSGDQGLHLSWYFLGMQPTGAKE